MKIKEFSIIRYGPLPSRGRISLSNFNLFLGKNEDGKTLTIDALTKLLLGQGIKEFEGIDRVEENPEGYVIIEDEEIKEIKLPEKGDLSVVADLTSTECRNIFIIRNSDLSIAHESEFYTHVTDRLIGLRTEELAKIKEALREIGKITPTEGKFRDIKEEKLKTRMGDARSLIGEINDLSEEIKAENLDELEKEITELEEEIEKIEQSIENLEYARKRKKYEKGKEALVKLKDALEKLREMEIYDENDKQSWINCENEINTYSEERRELLKQIEGKEKDFKELNTEFSEKQREFQNLKGIKRELDNTIRIEIKDYEAKSRNLASQEEKSKFFTSAATVSAILLAISLIGVIVSSSWALSILAILFLISTIVASSFKFLFVRDKAQLKKMFEGIKLDISRFGLDATNIEEILLNIQEFDEEYSDKEGEFDDIESEHDSLKIEIDRLKDDEVPKIDGKIRDAEDKINEIKGKSGEQTLQEYKKRLNLKANNEEEKNKQISVLGTLFDSEGETSDAMISYWEKEIETFKEYEDKALDEICDEGKEGRLREKKGKLKGRKGEISKSMENFQGRLGKIERKANEILREEDYLYCKTSVDLGAIKDKLQAFIDENENKRDNVLELMEIFEEIEMEEREKVSELFGKDSSISNYFKEITDGLYEEVGLQETRKIRIKRKDGFILDAEKLSGGAYDQLYLSIRLALGEKLLKDKKGFFIMDDPFVKADQDRLQKQIEMLKRISEFGWQVVYFTAKGEVKDILGKDIEKGNVNYVEIQGIFS